MTLLEIKAMKKENERMKSALAIISTWAGFEVEHWPRHSKEGNLMVMLDILKMAKKGLGRG